MQSVEDIIEFYTAYSEEHRLSRHELEKIRTSELLLRHLPQGPLRILDVGGGTGAYAFWLSSLGHAVHFIDLVPKHVQHVERCSAASEWPLASVSVGDARSLDVAEGGFDVVLLLGPLYHLTKREERLAALQEARRALKPGGLLFAAAISRYAGIFDGFWAKGLVNDPEYVRIMQQELQSGQHINVQGRSYFTTAYFHLADELHSEIAEAGFEVKGPFALESFGEFIPRLEAVLADSRLREVLLDTIRSIECDSSFIGMTGHLLAVGSKPEYNAAVNDQAATAASLLGIEQAYDAAAAEYASRFKGELNGKPFDRSILQRFAGSIADGGQLCELGCGSGEIAGFLHGLGVSVTGIDLSGEMVEAASRLNPGIAFRKGNMLALPEADGSYDGIVAFYSIVHFTLVEVEAAFREMYRVLKPDGKLLLAFHIGDAAVELNEFLGKKVELTFRFFDPDDIIQVLVAAGFTVCETTIRYPYPNVEYPSKRAYLLASKSKA